VSVGRGAEGENLQANSPLRVEPHGGGGVSISRP